jgi:hypothetical protein
MEEKVHAPTIGELPTARQLNRATLIAAGVAAVLLATVVFPAEYGVDPTGIGRVIGLTEMGEAKREVAVEADRPAAPAKAAGSGDLTLDEAPAATGASAAAQAESQSGEATLTLQPNQGSEVKATMKAGDEITYEWATDGPKINFELHGEEHGAAAGDYTSYEKGTSPGASGTFRAPFDGTHGWYWRNRSDAPITITVKAKGSFEKFARIES